MYLQLLSSAMGTSSGTKKYHKDKGFNLDDCCAIKFSLKAKKFKIEK